MSGRARLTVFAALATLFTAWSLNPLVESGGWLPQAALLLALQSAVGAGARRVPLARTLTVASQVLVSLLALMLVFGGKMPSAAGEGLLDYLVTDFGALFRQGVQDVNEFSMPAPLTDGIRLLLVSGVLLIGLLVDLLAVTVRTAAAAGLPLLALYSVAAGLSGAATGSGGASWTAFLLAGCGYLLLLLAEGRDRLAQWGRVFGAAPPGRVAAGYAGGGQALAPVRTGRRLGAVALGLALAVPAVLPSMGSGLLGTGGGAGEGEGNGLGPSIQAVNPLVSLQSSLNTQDNRVVLRYRTDSPQLGEQYLRILALDEFNGIKWEASGRALTDVPKRMPNPPGVSESVLNGATEVQTFISSAQTYAQRYLPMPYPATGVDIAGKWRFEPAGRTLVGDQLGKEKFQNAQGVQYSVRSLLLNPTAEQLRRAPAADPEIAAEYTKVPDNLPAVVVQTAREVTRGTKDDYSAAVKLQDYFAVSGGFRYDTKVSSGTGSQAIAKFLADKEGFCVHFAFSMASMARTLGIPARVAVGFTPGVKQADGVVNVSMRDAHAWPELYFEGVGWTRFEPTPRSGITVPDYSRPSTPQTQPSVPTAAPSASAAQPSAGPSTADDCPPDQRRLGECGPAAGQRSTGAGGDGPSAATVLAWTAGGVLLLALPLLPFLWRGRSRARRLGSGGVLAAWRELGDAAWDVGILPDEALSPRGAADRVVSLGRLDAEAAGAVRRVAGAVERELYAPPGAEPPYGELAADVLLARAGLLAGVSRRSRLRARFLPRSAARVRWAASARWSELTGRFADATSRVRARARIPLRGRG
ncbi:transglutaminaseTgpA domain-containing protein [Streptomyces sp. NPDC099050]|uniref:transglutaminase family protein n=1 Tax=Streptomyces sp. NPDC099050 TaxID=3366100 RepID=UPI0037FCA7B6